MSRIAILIIFLAMTSNAEAMGPKGYRFFAEQAKLKTVTSDGMPVEHILYTYEFTGFREKFTLCGDKPPTPGTCDSIETIAQGHLRTDRNGEATLPAATYTSPKGKWLNDTFKLETHPRYLGIPACGKAYWLPAASHCGKFFYSKNNIITVPETVCQLSITKTQLDQKIEEHTSQCR